MGPRREVAYGPETWELLRALRERAISVLKALRGHDIEASVFGSVARGDVRPGSDVDIFIPAMVSSIRVGLALEGQVRERSVVQATPRALVKALFVLDDGTSVIFPLIQPRQTELEFYRFGGEMGLEGILKGERACGVDKRLMFIEPTPWGHIETPLSDLSPGWVAKKIGVGQAIVEERMRVLERRAEVGRTGIYLQRPLAPDEAPEQVLSQLAYEDPALRRRIQK
ncbi:putative nucleotidyltransferase [Methanocella conradii HZ254]|uniref:Nucleotidyltransferase n=2 Tax=Methanocella TaxID=570266 RepID=H8I9B6_METCZ|nr:putative nucleotidyltransferase [Methanocella conradii HZ254]